MKKKKKEPLLKTNKYRDENWFPLLGHEQMYEISDYGRLKQIRTNTGLPIKIIQKGIKLKRKGRKELIVNVVSPKTGRVNNVPLRFLMEMQFFDRKYVKPIDGDFTNLKLSNLILLEETDE
ncbi:TPA: NUMOD4 domain-containing protein [Streptococcus suis]